jgi:hypothetical protein
MHGGIECPIRVQGIVSFHLYLIRVHRVISFIFILFIFGFCILSRLLEEQSLATTLKGVYFIYILLLLHVLALLAIFRWNTQEVAS